MTIGIIGGGAAGLMAAATILETRPDAQIILIEKNNGLGKKVIISGGGRCNVTTGIHDIPLLLTKYPRGGKFLPSAMHNFPPEAVYDWFEAHGVPLKTEDDLRVFPVSNNGKDIVGVFEKLFKPSSVHIFLNAQAIAVQKSTQGFEITLKGHDEPVIADRLILTTGGQAYRHTGSTGDGYAFAIALGHTITPLAASLNAFFTKESWPAQISGLSFEKATFTATREKSYSFTGPFLFTHKGVSGPAVFALSSLVAFETYDANNPLAFTIDLFPDLSADELRSSIEDVVLSHAKKSFLNALATMVPKSFATLVGSQLSISVNKRGGDMSKKDIQMVTSWLKAIPLHAIARGAGDEFVTAGGVDLKEVNPSTMESKICPGLFFAGEILDVDGFTGGFNLQASWAAGRLAGEHAALV